MWRGLVFLEEPVHIPAFQPLALRRQPQLPPVNRRRDSPPAHHMLGGLHCPSLVAKNEHLVSGCSVSEFGASHCESRKYVLGHREPPRSRRLGCGSSTQLFLFSHSCYANTAVISNHRLEQEFSHNGRLSSGLKGNVRHLVSRSPSILGYKSHSL